MPSITRGLVAAAFAASAALLQTVGAFAAPVGTVLFYFNSSYIPPGAPASSVFLPYVGYINTSGNISDWFFESTILIDLRVGAPTKSEWTKYLDNTLRPRSSQFRFSSPGATQSVGSPPQSAQASPYARLFLADDAPLPALNSAVVSVGNALHDQVTRHGVVLTIPWRNVKAGDFDPASPSAPNLSTKEGIQAAVRWFVDEAARRWDGIDARDRQRLYLKGFYWMEEAQSGYLGVQEQAQMFTEISEYIRSRGFEFSVSPYNRGFERPSYDDRLLTGFDNVWLQPNAWPAPRAGTPEPHWITNYAAEHVCRPTTVNGLRKDGIPVCEISDVISEVQRRPWNFSVNIEWKLSADCDNSRILDYLGLVAAAFKTPGRSFVVYEEGGLIFMAARSSRTCHRDVYDAIYRFFRTPAKNMHEAAALPEIPLVESQSDKK